MARRGRGPRRRPAFGWPSLTPAERDVASLVARGLTNPEIAARLGVTAGTVKDHVSSALRKLGVRTRAELAATISGHAGM
jgi:DNA-binding CsgD family transcriptional regulator